MSEDSNKINDNKNGNNNNLNRRSNKLLNPEIKLQKNIFFHNQMIILYHSDY